MVTPGRLGRDEPMLVVDDTGRQGGIIDTIKELGAKLDQLVPCVITGGQAAHHTGGRWCVPQALLVEAVQNVLGTRRLRVPRSLPLAGTLVDELERFQVKTDPESGRDAYGAFHSGQHDDLVFAVAFGIWHGNRRARERGEYRIAARHF